MKNIICLILILFSVESIACSPVRHSLEGWVELSESIYIGSVIKEEYKKSEQKVFIDGSGNERTRPSHPHTLYTLKVENNLKGKESSTVNFIRPCDFGQKQKTILNKKMIIFSNPNHSRSYTDEQFNNMGKFLK